jgi:hypothetical protein
MAADRAQRIQRMKYKTLFRVLLKLIGVWVFIYGLMQGAAEVRFLPFVFDDEWGNPWESTRLIAAALGMALGLYLFLGGEWIVNQAIPGNRPYCHECGYDLSKVTGPECPECGTAFKKPPGENA